jgi:hypothetical protein
MILLRDLLAGGDLNCVADMSRAGRLVFQFYMSKFLKTPLFPERRPHRWQMPEREPRGAPGIAAEIFKHECM